MDDCLAQVPNLKLWQAASFEFLQSVVARIESKCGRLNPWAVEGRGPITTHLKQVSTFDNSVLPLFLPLDSLSLSS